MNLPLLAALLVFHLALFGASGQKPLIITTDCGAEVDDQWTIAQAVLAPELEVLGIITTHAPSLKSPASKTSAKATRDLLVHLGLAKSPPVLAGASTALPNSSTPLGNLGVDFLLAQSWRFSSTNRLPVLILGAATDIASALLLDPALADRVEFVAMAFDGWPKGGDSWNVKNDIVAWQIVMNSTVPLVVGDAAVTRRDLAVNRRQSAEWLPLNSGAARHLVQIHSKWLDHNPSFIHKVTGDKDTWPIWDQVTVAWLLKLAQGTEHNRPKLQADLTLKHDGGRTNKITWITNIHSTALWKHFSNSLIQKKQ